MILVMGGAGYIGSHTVKYLLAHGEKCVVSDNLSYGHREAVDERADFVLADLADKDSLREVFDGRRVAAIFQPHLYTRTRDFYPDFADALSLLDEVILLDIYPAREEPIAGVTSQLIYDRLRPEMKKTMTEKAKLLDLVRERAADFDVLVVLGAGDADNLCPEITDILLAR